MAPAVEVAVTHEKMYELSQGLYMSKKFFRPKNFLRTFGGIMTFSFNYFLGKKS